MKPPTLLTVLLAAVLLALGSAASAQNNIEELIRERGFTPEQVEAALKTYIPSGEHDTHLMFASGGHGGQVLVYGLPSMRLMRVIGVFAAEPWQGYGFTSGSQRILEEGSPEEHMLNWGDTHHPALSMTDFEYDGEWLFINDKAHARIAVISLTDFMTKQIVKHPLKYIDHGTHVTNNTEYVVQSTQYPVPLPPRAMEMTEENYQEYFRGLFTFWKFDREAGRIDTEASFALELPPYWQDLVNVGRGESDGFIFVNSINTELAIPGILEGRPPLEVSVSERDMDYMHVINWRKAEEVVADGNYEMMEGMRVITLETAIDEGLLHFIPEPKSPHGVDTSPDGRWIVISGKLDPNVTVYDVREVKALIEAGEYQNHDVYGVPILSFEDTVAAQVNVGLGPLHTQFDGQGYAYTSLFIDSAVARWSLGEPYFEGDDAWQLVQKLPVHYSIGHISTVMGDTIAPESTYLVALNKWSQDRFTNVGPLLPQNLQLIDIAGDEMKIIYDAPVGIGEPHYAQIIPVDRLDPIQAYEFGTDAYTMQPSEHVTNRGEERIERDDENGVVDVYMTFIRSTIVPDLINVQQGDRVRIHITSLERARDVIHGFGLSRYNVHASLEPGATLTVEFDADRAGVFPYYCTEFCSPLHLEMAGYLIIHENE